MEKMAEGRMLKKVISTSKKLALVSDRAKVIWFMMLPHTDIQGRVSACPDIVKGQYLTLLNYPVNSIQKCLIELHNAGLIILYKVEDNQYAEFARFKDFQSLRPEREGESVIPPPNSNATPVVLPESSGLSKDKLSKDKLSKENIYTQRIFGIWNLQKQYGEWKAHRKLTPDIRKAIDENLKEYSAEEISEAIGNFRLVLHGQDYLWTYDGWGLREFLSRRDKDDRSVRQWLRFHPNNFRESDWLTPAARQKRINKQRSQEDNQKKIQKYVDAHRQWILETDPDILIRRCQADPLMDIAVKQLRPEIFDKDTKHE